MSKNLRSFIKSFLAFSTGSFLHSIISFFTTPIITYIIAPAEFGKVTMFNLFYSVLVIIVRFGSESAFIRFYYEFDENKRKNLLWTCLYISFSALIIVSIIMIIFWKSFSYAISGVKDFRVIIFMIITLFFGLLQLFNLQSIRMKNLGWIYSSIQVVNSLSKFFGILLFSVIFNRNFYSVLSGQIIGVMVAFFVGISFELELWIPTNFDPKIAKKILSYSIPLVPASLSGWFFRSVDKLTVRNFETFDSMGLYSVAQKLTGVLNLVQGGFSAFWAPTAYKRFYDNKDDRYIYSSATKIVSAVMFTLATLTVTFKDVLFLLVAKNYSGASQIAPFLVFVPLFATLSETTMLGINFSGKTYWHLYISLTAGFTNFAVSRILVPIISTKGAAISMAFSYLLIFTLRTLISAKLFKVNYELKKIYLSTALLSFQCLFATFFNNALVNILIGFLVLLIFVFIYKEVFLSILIPQIREVGIRIIRVKK